MLKNVAFENQNIAIDKNENIILLSILSSGFKDMAIFQFSKVRFFGHPFFMSGIVKYVFVN